MQESLATRISGNEELTIDEQASIHELLMKRCGSNTKQKMWQVLARVPYIFNYGIFNRVMLENGRANYCAGQSYSDEIRTVRELLLKG